VADVELIDSNVWSYKPAWCQPPSIVLTGMAVVASTWVLSQSYWWTGVVALAVTTWWSLFLVVMPAQFKELVERNPEYLKQLVGPQSPNSEINDVASGWIDE
jgi:hypothetical protein